MRNEYGQVVDKGKLSGRIAPPSVIARFRVPVWSKASWFDRWPSLPTKDPVPSWLPMTYRPLTFRQTPPFREGPTWASFPGYKTSQQVSSQAILLHELCPKLPIYIPASSVSLAPSESSSIRALQPVGISSVPEQSSAIGNPILPPTTPFTSSSWREPAQPTNLVTETQHTSRWQKSQASLRAAFYSMPNALAPKKRYSAKYLDSLALPHPNTLLKRPLHPISEQSTRFVVGGAMGWKSKGHGQGANGSIWFPFSPSTSRASSWTKPPGTVGSEAIVRAHTTAVFAKGAFGTSSLPKASVSQKTPQSQVSGRIPVSTSSTPLPTCIHARCVTRRKRCRLQCHATLTASPPDTPTQQLAPSQMPLPSSEQSTPSRTFSIGGIFAGVLSHDAHSPQGRTYPGHTLVPLTYPAADGSRGRFGSGSSAPTKPGEANRSATSNSDPFTV